MGLRRHPRPFQGGNPWREAEITFTRYPVFLPRQFDNQPLWDRLERFSPVSLEDDGDYWISIDPASIEPQKERITHHKEEDNYSWGRYHWRPPHRDPRRQERKFKAMVRAWVCA